MTYKDEDLSRLVRESARIRWTLAALPAAFLVATVANATAGGGQVDGWLSFAVALSAVLALVTFVIRFVTWRRAGGLAAFTDDLPVWGVRAAGGLAAGWLAAAVIIALTP